ncbi:3-hydroxyacyl-CoA dehydrogenase family protein [Bifidobacterium magnum]|uniref:L-gulonate 3-dehydrogenase n=1 Tax=Bifidobacterium magnum TaxID=1692 RepID=A0A087B6D1_9BIFI|nr:3-hydroxyacyl-CoA dehydrogenase family protein [Bifidobacterium magnum]KFI66581.1 3-hydroxyacyl-CoA dehydrogenase [Bifidobacterium magnum]
MAYSLENITHVANIGAGTMGHAIALQFAMHGYEVALVETGSLDLREAMDRTRAEARELAEHGLLPGGDVEGTLARIHPTYDLRQGVEDADFIIESIVENLQVKKTVWAHIEQHAKADAIFATNTSGLSPTAIQQALERPERFVVAHFWNPAQLMPLVEVVPGEATDPAVAETTTRLMAAIGKKPAQLAREAYGFVGNRLQCALLREATNIVREGIADAQTVDTVMENSLGLRWSILGPLASADLGGLDVFFNVSQYLNAAISANTGTDPLLADMVERGDLGRKKGHGFYDWTGPEGERRVAMRDQKLMEAMEARKADGEDED